MSRQYNVILVVENTNYRNCWKYIFKNVDFRSVKVILNAGKNNKSNRS